MRIQNIIYTIVFSLIFSLAHCQKGKINKANKEYHNLAYVKTSEILLEVVNNGYKSEEVLQKLANAFYFNKQMEEASKWYGELFALEESQDSEYYFRYAIALRSVEDYEASNLWMQKFLQNKPEDLRGKAFALDADYKTTIEDHSRYDLKLINLNINTELSDFGIAQYGDEIIFASARGGGKKYSWNNQPFLDVYAAGKQSDSTYNMPYKIKGTVNTKYHESNVAFTNNDSIMYFTRNNFYKNKYEKDNKGINRLKLYRATKLNNGSWGEIHSVHFNSDDYSVAHPTISKDGKRLYFASDMTGTLGASDIFVVDINDDGTLGTPMNLGASINTEGQESFPFINANGDLYFSSNGFPGLGALDVFMAKSVDENLNSDNQNFTIKNVGKPVNSKADDFAYFENIETKEVFFSSNREGGKGSDDIYAFIKTQCTQTVKVFVKDQDSDKPISASALVLLDENGQEIESIITTAEGMHEYILECNKEYLVRAGKDRYLSDEKRFTVPMREQDLQIDLALAKDVQIIEPCDDLAKVLDIPIIYFDFDKSNIRYDAEVELQKVLVVLNKYPSMHIDIRSHTDCRGTEGYNERLSEKRAQSTRTYLIHKGIASQRLTAKGYGESRLVNNCGCEPSNNSSCTEEEHQKNRRSEFIITSINGKTCNEK